MVKRVITEPGRTFTEFSLLPGYTSADGTMHNVTLETKLADGFSLKIPLLSAAMTSVTGYEMALALGKEGGLAVLPERLPVDEQAGIVRQVKQYEMGFVERPLAVEEDTTIEQVLALIQKHGHSKIPITNRNNVFLGMFILQHYLQTPANGQDPVTTVMIPAQEIHTSTRPDLSVDKAKELLGGHPYLVVLDEQDRLVKLAFQKDIEQIRIGAAISTRGGWKKRVEATVAAGADLIVIDTSDAHSEFVSRVIEEYKAMGIGIPLCAGNVVTDDGAYHLMEAGAGMVKIGMSSGSICTTRREKAVGRAPMTALLEAGQAREQYYKHSGRYVPLIMDGGVSTAADMIIALTVADAVMMGSYFNAFYEAAAEKFDSDGKVTRNESDIRYVAIWGEGSARARNLSRYGHNTRETFFTEGVEGKVSYQGRLKPKLREDLMKIKAALSNAGCHSLVEYRRKAVLELMSFYSQQIVGDTHSIEKRG